ncbi:unnamed protein product [Linum tenue]|uniref:Uncharacterized protein n=1 Tax=Linum tenue TaxID=586396 RepID=A0AAV0JJG5_9ROSI|nr:unnamed protein product [Linum tenue]
MRQSYLRIAWLFMDFNPSPSLCQAKMKLIQMNHYCCSRSLLYPRSWHLLG